MYNIANFNIRLKAYLYIYIYIKTNKIKLNPISLRNQNAYVFLVVVHKFVQKIYKERDSLIMYGEFETK
jgi:hypothetical protein